MEIHLIGANVKSGFVRLNEIKKKKQCTDNITLFKDITYQSVIFIFHLYVNYIPGLFTVLYMDSNAKKITVNSDYTEQKFETLIADPEK